MSWGRQYVRVDDVSGQKISRDRQRFRAHFVIGWFCLRADKVFKEDDISGKKICWDWQYPGKKKFRIAGVLGHRMSFCFRADNVSRKTMFWNRNCVGAEILKAKVDFYVRDFPFSELAKPSVSMFWLSRLKKRKNILREKHRLRVFILKMIFCFSC